MTVDDIGTETRYAIEGLENTYSRHFAFQVARVQAERENRPVRMTALGIRLNAAPAEKVRELENLLVCMVDGSEAAASLILDLVDGPEFWQPVARFDVQPDGSVVEVVKNQGQTRKSVFCEVEECPGADTPVVATHDMPAGTLVTFEGLPIGVTPRAVVKGESFVPQTIGWG